MILPLRTDRPVNRPWYARIALGLAIFTALPALAVGALFIADPSGGSIGLPEGWIEGTIFRSYLVPGLYLFGMNGVGMLVVAAAILRRHWTAPWLAGVLGAGLVAWIGVQLLVMPETMFLQAVFGAIGLVMLGIAVAWLRGLAAAQR